MNLELTETQILLRDTVRGYLEREVDFDRIRELERSGSWDRALWKEFVEQGWLGLPYSDARGGGGGSLVDVGILIEELARRAAIVPILEVIVAGIALERFAPSSVADSVLGALLAGDAIPVPADPGSARPRDTGATLELRDGLLSGERRFVDYGQFATHHLVSIDDAGTASLLLVDASAPGITTEPLRSIGRTPLCHVHYDRVEARYVGGEDAAQQLVRLGRALAAIQCVGSMQQALDMTVAYARVREQFGKPIGSFQAVRHHCANMAIQVARSRLLAYEALDALDRGTASDALVAAAKASASRSVPEVTMLAHQIHGGNGVIEDNDLYFFTLRGKERSLAWGGVDECLAVMAETVSDESDWL